MSYGNDKIAVIGLGYVGLPLASQLTGAGYNTVGIDTDGSKVRNVNDGVSYIKDLSSEELAKAVRNGLSATDDISVVGETDCIVICVPTPVTEHKTPDMSAILKVVEGITPHIRKGHLIVLRSTTYPGTTRELVAPAVEIAGLNIGEDCHVAFAPERVDPGNERYGFHNTPVVVGGMTEACTRAAAGVLADVSSEVVQVSSPEAAEMTKLLENIFRSVNIALINEMAALCDRMGGIDIWEVIDAAGTKPFGFMKFYPGPGIGGHCIQIDPYYLSWKAKEYNFYSDFIEQAAKTNENMPHYVSDMTVKALSMSQTSLENSSVLILGVAYKPDIEDVRNSPGIHVWEALEDLGVGNIVYSDPYVPTIEVNGKTRSSVELTRELVKSVDCVVITTNHTVYDYGMILKHAKTIVDTRNATARWGERSKTFHLLGGGRIGAGA